MSTYYRADWSAHQNLTDPAERIFAITPGVGPITDYEGSTESPPTGGTKVWPRALLCSEAMTVTMVDIAGFTRTDVPLIAGWNPLGAQEIHSISAGAIWGIK